MRRRSPARAFPSRRARPRSPADAPLAERRDTVFMGTSVATGAARARGRRDRQWAPSWDESRTFWHDRGDRDAAAGTPASAGSDAALPLPGDRRRGRAARARPRAAAAGGVHVRRLAGGGRRSRGVAGHRHHRAGDRRSAHGVPQRARSQAARRRDARLRDGHLHRQDRHPDQRRRWPCASSGGRSKRRCWPRPPPVAMPSSAATARPAAEIRPSWQSSRRRRSGE